MPSLDSHTCTSIAGLFIPAVEEKVLCLLCIAVFSLRPGIFLGLIGAIELAILADYYGREIAAYDIQTTRCDLYGQVSAFSSFGICIG